MSESRLGQVYTLPDGRQVVAAESNGCDGCCLEATCHFGSKYYWPKLGLPSHGKHIFITVDEAVARKLAGDQL